MDMQKFQDFLNTDPNFNAANHIRFTVVEEGYCECQVDLTQAGLNPQRVAHGSLLFTLCDCVTGVAAASYDRDMLTQAANIHFLRTTATGTLTAKSRVVKLGRRTGLVGAEVYDQEGRLLCTSEFSIFFTGNEMNWGEQRRSK